MMLRNYLIEKIMHEIKGVRLNGHPTNRLPGNVNVSFSRRGRCIASHSAV